MSAPEHAPHLMVGFFGGGVILLVAFTAIVKYIAKHPVSLHGSLRSEEDVKKTAASMLEKMDRNVAERKALRKESV